MAGPGEFVEHRCTFPIHLHPSRLGDVRGGVEEQLNGLLMTFVDELGGVLLSYSELKLASSPATNPLHCGFIFQERSYIHFEVTVKALTWRVAVGETYDGVVNAVAGDHLAILLHGAFNATIPLAGALAPATWQYDADKDRWIDTDLFKGDEAEKDEDDDDASVKEEVEAAASNKKLTKKELKKLERRRLRDVMLAATGRGAAAKQARPAAGVITRGVHVRFECSAVQHSDEYFKLTGVVVSKRKVSGSSLGLTGGFTPLAPVEGEKQMKNDVEEEAEAQDADGDFDMSALAAVTAPPSASKSNGRAPATPAKSAPSPMLAATPAPAASAAATPAKKAHTDKQQEKYLKKKAKLAERMAAKESETGAAAEEEDEDEDAPVKSSKKKRKGDEPEAEDKKKKKKMKLES